MTSVFTKKNNWTLIFIVFISIISILQSYLVQFYFSINSLPVYDGVMYEKQQILRYLSFKGNFSLIERYNQFIYELTGNPVSGGFTSLTCLMNPKWLVNGFNIYLRSFFSMLFFLGTLYLLLRDRVKTRFLFIILFLITQVPIFYHYRFGLGSYIPDVPAALNLISAYVITYLVLNRKISFNWIFLIPILISIALFSRYNFFVYTAILFLALLPMFWKFLKRERFSKPILYFLAFLVCFIVIWGFYGLLHFDFFLSYYAKPAEYQQVNLQTSIFGLWNYFKSMHGWVSVLILILILNCLKYGKKENSPNSFLIPNKWLMVYPAAILFLFLYVILNATNQPHVNSAWVVFLIVAIIGLGETWNYKPFSLKNRFLITFLSIIILSSIGFSYISHLKNYSRKDTHTNMNLELFGYIEKYGGSSPSYFFTHDSELEIPFDVAYFRKNGIWLDNDLRFYFTDWNFYDIDKSLDCNKIAAYYEESIKNRKPDFITFPQDYDLLRQPNALTNQVRNLIEEKILDIGYVEMNTHSLVLNDHLNIFQITNKH